MEIWEMSTKEILSLLKTGKVSAQQVLESYLDRIAEVEPKVHAYLELLEPQARAEAAKIDSMLLRGEDPGLLSGLPCALKDNLCLQGAHCTCASRILEGWVAPYNATCVSRLRKQGAVFLGKTNMDEFAMGSSTENSAFGPTRNPWDLDRVPGGSSGGSAAAVAAGMAPVALGSDTGGSIRQPASFTGIYGLKPTYGLVSRYGLVAFASSLDQVGPLGQSVWDCALLLEAIAGYDPKDSTSSEKETFPYTKHLDSPVKGLRAAVPKEFLGFGISDQVRNEFEKTLKKLSDMGVIVEETSLPTLPYALDTYYVIAPSEASSNLSRFDGVRYGLRVRAGNLDEMYKRTRAKGFGKEVRRRIMLGTFALSAGYYDAYYLRAARIRTLIRRDFQKSFEKYDVLLSPTTPTVAFKIGEKIDDPLSMYLADVLTVPVNLAGLCALSMPCGFAQPEDQISAAYSKLLPCGIQIIGKPFDEKTVLSLGYALEQEIGGQIKEKLAEMRRNLSTVRECEPVG